MIGKKYTYEEVKQTVESFGYILISKEYIGCDIPLIFVDKQNYFYRLSFYNFKKGYIPKKFSKSNPYTIQNIKLWLEINKKPFLLISEIYEGNDKYLQWKCLKNGCGEIFKMIWSDVSQGHGCPYCEVSPKKVGITNCLATKNPNLASEWHSSLNGDLTPYNVTCNSGKKVWWQCSKNIKHVWKALISHRNNNVGCPYCSGFYPSEDYNLLVINPKICKEWDYLKNDKRPEEYTPNTDKKVWWKCKECGHEWKTMIITRNKGSGCPQCSESKGEKRIKEFLIINNINHIPQKEFDNLLGLGNRNLSYDFYLPYYNLLIEYQGQQHEKYIPGFHKSKRKFIIQQEHDKRKKQYSIDNNIKLLEIWYWDFNNIEEILEKEFLTILK